MKNNMVKRTLWFISVFITTIYISTSCSLVKPKTPKIAGSKTIHTAATQGALSEVEQLVIEGGNVNERDALGETPLYNAVISGHEAIVKFLIAHGADVNARNYRGKKPLHYCIALENKNICELLMKHGANVNEPYADWETPLHKAVTSGNELVVQFLIDLGADVNSKNGLGNTPLHEAARGKQEAVAIVLLAHEADVNAENKDGNTPLYFAARTGNKEICKLLIAYGADVNVRDKSYGETALYTAVIKGDTALVKLLLTKGADPNITNMFGNTPLQEAVLRGNRKAALALVKYGAIFPDNPHGVGSHGVGSSLGIPSRPSKDSIGVPPYREYRVFPWPPPAASTRVVIPRHFVLNSGKVMLYLYDVDKTLSAALQLSGYTEKSYYSVPGGFALVTRLEQINPDGTPKEGAKRWNVEVDDLDTFSLKAYIKALFKAPVGYYRVILFVIISEPFSEVHAKVSQSEAMKWLSGGLNELPSWIRDIEYSEKHTCTALIYEFEKTKHANDATLRMPSRLPAKTHLVKAGFWGSFKQ